MLLKFPPSLIFLFLVLWVATVSCSELPHPLIPLSEERIPTALSLQVIFTISLGFWKIVLRCINSGRWFEGLIEYNQNWKRQNLQTCFPLKIPNNFVKYSFQMPLPSIFKLYCSYIKVTDINLPFLSHQRKDGTGIWHRVRTGAIRLKVKVIHLGYCDTVTSGLNQGIRKAPHWNQCCQIAYL